MLTPISWTGSAVRLLDQTRLPAETVYVDIVDEKQMHDAIRRLVVRGAPAIGIAAAFGAYLGVRGHVDDSAPAFFARLKGVCEYLATSRPTAVNLFWALERIQRVARDLAGIHDAASPACQVVRDVVDVILNECLAMIEEDHRVCRAIGANGLEVLIEAVERRGRRSEAGGQGAELKSEISNLESQISVLKSPISNLKSEFRDLRILTHCNAGALATAGYGTALAPIYVGLERGLRFEVFADETRPLLQGSRITAYELHQAGVPVTVLCDSAAASVLARHRVDAVIVGADRIARNGDTANKIGTLPLAIAARHFGVPFYVAAPVSTLDPRAKTGADIPIERRKPEEVVSLFGKVTAPDGVGVYNPAFDVTPAELIDAIITEKGVARPPLGGWIERWTGPESCARCPAPR